MDAKQIVKIVNGAWLKERMGEHKKKSTDIAFETGIAISTLSDIRSDNPAKKVASTRVLLWNYFKRLELEHKRRKA